MEKGDEIKVDTRLIAKIQGLATGANIHGVANKVQAYTLTVDATLYSEGEERERFVERAKQLEAEVRAMMAKIILEKKR